MIPSEPVWDYGINPVTMWGQTRVRTAASRAKDNPKKKVEMFYRIGDK